MPDNTENQDLIDTAQQAVDPTRLERGIYFNPITGDTIDLRAELHAFDEVVASVAESTSRSIWATS